MTVVVATTLAAFVMDQDDTWGAWLRNAEAIKASHDDVRYFCAIETDARHLGPFGPLVEALHDLGADWWTYHLDDGRTQVTTGNRIRHLTMGQNLASEYATAAGATHLLFLAADLEPPPDCLPKLLEVDHPLVGGHVPTYCLDGPMDVGYPASWDVRTHMPTAAFVLIARRLFKQIKWRGDGEEGMTDDPAFHHDARTLHGVEALVRHDCVGRHWPESIGAIETRGHDMEVRR